MTDTDAIRLGISAEAVLDNPAFQQAMDDIEAQTIEQWASGNFKTAQEREDAYSLVRGARTFKSRLIGMLENAKLTKAQAEQRDRGRASHGTPFR